jgi:GTPase SAR1 family protein
MSGSLFDLFTSCYQKFDEGFCYDTVHETSIILFGISGAGKSTFMARLLSSMSPENFCKEVQAEDGVKPFSDISGIRIGHEAPSMTLVPHRYEVSKMGVYDVPGFKDGDENRQVVINILHKCLLNLVTSAKFLVVLDMRNLFDENAMTVIIDDYHNKLRELFGEENYSTYLGNVHFILTHNDKDGMGKSEEVISDTINEKMFEVSNVDNPDLERFFNRLLKHHFVVDYAVQKQPEFVKIVKTIFGDKDVHGIRTDKMDTNRRLEVHANALNRKCLATMDDKTDSLKTDLSTCRIEFELKHTRAQAGVAEIAQVVQQVDACKTTIESLKCDNVRLQERIRQSRAEAESSRLTTAETERLQQSLIDQQCFLTTEMAEEKDIMLRQDHSRNTGVARNWYEFKSLIGIEPQENERTTILVIRSDRDGMCGERTLRDHIDNGGSLMPKTIDRINSYVNDNVLCNSTLKVTKDLSSSVYKYNTERKELMVHFASAVEFTVLIYTMVDFKGSSVDTVLSQHYERVLADCTTRLDFETRRLGALEDGACKDNDTMKQNKKALVTAHASLTKGEADHENQLQVFRTLLKEFEQWHSQWVTRTTTQDIGHDKEATQISKICDIFVHNRLDTTLSDKIGDHRKRVQEVLFELTAQKQAIDSMTPDSNVVEEQKQASVSPTRGSNASSPVKQ